MLHLDAIRKGRLNRSPFEWAQLHDLVPSAKARDLVATFPEDGFTEAVTDWTARTDKTYRLQSRPLVLGGCTVDSALAPGWSGLVDEFLTADYAQALADLTGVDVEGLTPDVTMWRYGAGSWLSPHPDKPEKVITHVIYFNERWLRGWGGTFRILSSGDENDVHTEIDPLVGSSVVLVTSSSSWHCVPEVRSSSPVPDRCSLTVSLMDNSRRA